MRDFGFAADLRRMIALDDARKAENAALRARCRGDAELVAHLQADAERRGLREIDWVDYFRNIDINYP